MLNDGAPSLSSCALEVRDAVVYPVVVKGVSNKALVSRRLEVDPVALHTPFAVPMYDNVTEPSGIFLDRISSSSSLRTPVWQRQRPRLRAERGGIYLLLFLPFVNF